MIILFVLLSTAFAARGQVIPSPSPTPLASPTPSLEQEFFRNVLRDQKAIWTAPFNLHSSDAKWLVPGSIGTMALITTDRITGDEVAESDDLGTASKILSFPGSIYGVAAVEGSFYIFGRKENDERARETGILSAEASIDSLIVSSALKGISQRGRPDTGADRSEFFDGGSSFPSGHAIQAWSVATVVANEYSDHRAVQVAAYGIASAVSLARFTGEKHYLSDVLVGSALGYGIGKYVYSAHHRKKSQSDVDGESRLPAISPEFNRGAHRYGIALTWSF
jgi:hypothetical protein